MKGKGSALIICILAGMAVCAQKINPENPDLSPANFRLDSLPKSEINIPVQISLKPLYRMAEQSVDTLFTSPGYPDGWVQDGCDTRYKYSFRRSPLEMKAIGTSLSLGFMGYYKIVGSTRVCVNGTVISPWTPPCRCGFSESERRVKVSFTNSLNLLPDFKVRLDIRRNEPEPLDKCEVCFWGQDITRQVMKGLVQELDGAKKSLDKEYGLTDLRPRFQDVWDQLNKVYNLYGLGWLQINPQRVRINNLYADNDSLNIYIGLDARPVISFERPVENHSFIPNIASFGSRPGFNIFLDAVLNYDSLSRIVNSQLAGKKFEFRKAFIKKKFIIEECRLYGAGSDKLIIKVNFSGTNDGVFYLVGKPVFNKETRTIEIEDIDFDIKSKNVLLGSADWLFDKKITKEISKAARFELGSYIDTARTTINQQLNQEWKKGIRSYGNINEITLVGIYPLQKNLVIRTNCSGTLSMKVESIDFSL